MATSEVEVTCLVRTGFDASVTWLLDGTVAPSNKVTREVKTTHIETKVTVSTSQWKGLKTLTCRAEHGCFVSTEKTVNVAGETLAQPETQSSCKSK